MKDHNSHTEAIAGELIAKWKLDQSLRARFPRFIDYVVAVELMLDGRAPMDMNLFVVH